MKKFLLILIVLMLALLCACHEDEPFVGPMPAPEKVAVTVSGADYEVLAPAKTRFEIYDGIIAVTTPSISKGPVTVDLSGLSGCGFLNEFYVELSGETEKLVLPKLPENSYCSITGESLRFLDASGAEGCESLVLETGPDKIEIGKGPKNLTVFCDFDLSKLAGAENIKSITVNGSSDFSKIADIGAVESIYILGGSGNISGLKNLKSLKKLSLHVFTGDLSGIRKLSMQTLAIGSDVTQETVDTLTKSETVTDLHINDEFLTNSDFMEKFPNLKTLVLSVDPIQPAEIPLRDEITDVSQIELLETNLDKKPLEAFFENGGKIFIMDDWSRT